ncbi:MAG: TauD/TfdA family dioxygenase [Pseudomonadota bacterium]
MTPHIRPIPDAPFGALCTGVDLRCEQSQAAVQAMRAGWLDHQVLVFPDQPLSLDEFERASLLFGDFGAEPYLRGMDSHPHIVRVQRLPDEEPAPFGSSWHSDWSFRRQPPSATLLHAQVVPPSGGDTLFASAQLAWAALDAETQAQIRHLSGLHSARRSYSLAGFEASGGERRSMRIEPSDEAYAVEQHPLVALHPETGRASLFINWVYTIGIEGLPGPEGEALLQRLLEHSVREEFIYRHRWSADMLVLWDNRCLQHQATGGYDGHHRLMHRTTLAGEAPRAI